VLKRVNEHLINTLRFLVTLLLLLDLLFKPQTLLEGVI
jgi:hypothetical protein